MSAEADRVPLEWLVLREPADAEAHSAELADRLARHLPAGPLVIHDLGGGTGAMGRWLAPRLPGPQRWVVHDRDTDLLELAAASFETRHSDITRLAPEDLAGASLITASALLDMLTADELARMLRPCAGLPMLLALTVTGRVALSPADPLDARLGAAFNDHQQRGGRLGPDAVAAAVDQVRRGRPRPAEPVAPRRGPRRADGDVARRVDHRRLRAGARAGRRGRRLPGAAIRAGGRRRARRHRRSRRPAGAAVTAAVHPGRSTPSRRSVWRWARPAAAAGTLAVLIWHLGASPFLDGLRAVDAGALAAASALAVLTTVCCAWRWRIVARGLGAELSLGTAVAAYYRSLFLNVTLPGGVVGDVHRGISHGRDASDVGLGLRAVAWERSAGQVVQVALTVAVLLVVPSPVRASMPLVALALLATAAGVALAMRAWPRVRNELRDGILARRAWPAVALASALVVAGHAVTFVIAAHTAGATASASTLLPLALLVLLAGALPNVGGWGPREGVTAWAFAAAGLGASLGVATAVVYGVMVFVATLPGAAVLIVLARRGGAANA